MLALLSFLGMLHKANIERNIADEVEYRADVTPPPPSAPVVMIIYV